MNNRKAKYGQLQHQSTTNCMGMSKSSRWPPTTWKVHKLMSENVQRKRSSTSFILSMDSDFFIGGMFLLTASNNATSSDSSALTCTDYFLRWTIPAGPTESMGLSLTMMSLPVWSLYLRSEPRHRHQQLQLEGELPPMIYLIKQRNN